MSVPLIFADDTARARKSDPASSHVAADRSASTRGLVHEAVVRLIAQFGPLSGERLNEEYREWRAFNGWPVVAYESPRKRAGELVGTRLVVTNPDDPRGTPHIYALSEEA